MYDEIAGLRYNIESDGFDQFEAVCARDEQSAREYLLSQDGVQEVLVLQTCQRYEVYASGPNACDALAGIPRPVQLSDTRDRNWLSGEYVVEHLFRVACGLESGVLGEDEIIGQLRDAYSRAKENDALSGTLGLVVLKALRVGERARTETAINEGRVSLGSVVVDRVREEIEAFAPSPDEIEDCSMVVIGAGDIAELVVKTVTNRSPETAVTVANRTVEHAESLTDRLDGEAIGLDAVDDALLARTDVLVSATNADGRVVSADDLAGHDLVAFDLANPRDIATDAEALPEIRVVRIDDVLVTRKDGLQRRRAAVSDVERIMQSEREHLDEQLRIERVDDSLAALYARAHDLREAEFEQAQSRLARRNAELTDAQLEVMTDFAEAMVNKLLHPKTAAIREAAAANNQEAVDAWLELFDAVSTGAEIAQEDDESRTETEISPLD